MRLMLNLCRKYILGGRFYAYLVVTVLVGLLALAGPFLTGIVVNRLAMRPAPILPPFSFVALFWLRSKRFERD